MRAIFYARRGKQRGWREEYIDKKIEPRRMKIKGYRIARGYWTEIEGVGPWEGRGMYRGTWIE